jgi:hypothetical protein
MNEKYCNELATYDEKRVEKKDIDITKTPWYNIVKFGLGALLSEDSELRAGFSSKRDDSTPSRVLIEDKDGEVAEVIDNEE